MHQTPDAPDSAAGQAPAGYQCLHPSLPIFALPDGNRAVLYTPGHLAPTRADTPARLQAHWAAGTLLADDSLAAQARWLEAEAGQAIAAWTHHASAANTPECLTMYLSHACNLTCGYCYAGAARNGVRGERAVLDIDAVTAASVLVAKACADRGRPFQVVLHGGGEPLLHVALVRQIHDLTTRVAADRGIAWRGYVATNGVIERDTARWVAERFDRIGLSCDGPPDIHDAQRPSAGGSPSSPCVERTAAIVRAAGRRLEVRTTVTQRSVDRQSEIVDYLVSVLGAAAIRFEPAYGAGPASFRPDDAQRVAAGFLSAQARARELGATLDYSGVRLDEVHGPHCNTLKGVLQILPDGSVTSCFLASSAERHPRAIIGRYTAGRSVTIDHEHERAHRRSAARIPAFCARCVCVMHCARGCPDMCVASSPADADDELARDQAMMFRCELARHLAVAWIRQAAGSDPVRDMLPQAGQAATPAPDQW